MIYDDKNTYPPTIWQPLGYEVHGPLLIRPRRRSLRYALPLRPFLALLRSHDQTLLGIQMLDALSVHFPALAPQQNGQAAVAVAHPAAGQLAQADYVGPLAGRDGARSAASSDR